MKKETTVSAQVVLRGIEKQSKPLFHKLQRIEQIDSVATLDQAGTMLKALKEMGKEADKKEKTITEPLTQALNATRELFKPFKKLVHEEEVRVKQLILDYHEEQENKVKKLKQDFAEGKIKQATTFMKKEAELNTVSHSSSVRKIWRAVAVNEAKTPREYLIPDESAIFEALKQGKKVAGWELQQAKSIAI
jgi:phenylalanyl-tRNA synthetase alpha subunit